MQTDSRFLRNIATESGICIIKFFICGKLFVLCISSKEYIIFDECFSIGPPLRSSTDICYLFVCALPTSFSVPRMLHLRRNLNVIKFGLVEHLHCEVIKLNSSGYAVSPHPPLSVICIPRTVHFLFYLFLEYIRCIRQYVMLYNVLLTYNLQTHKHHNKILKANKTENELKHDYYRAEFFLA